jgi:hypothetical protein
MAVVDVYLALALQLYDAYDSAERELMLLVSN